MRILKRMSGWITGSAKPAASGLSTVVYVPRPPGSSGRGEPAWKPQDQLQILRRLCAFASKEEVRVICLFASQPLRKVPDGASQDGVLVRYAERDKLPDLVAEVVKTAPRSDVVVVAQDNDILDRARALKADVMQAANFEKALESMVGPLRQEPRRPQPTGQRGSLPPTPATEPQGKPAEAPTPQAPAEQPSAPAAPAPTPSSEQREEILKLIDPL